MSELLETIDVDASVLRMWNGKDVHGHVKIFDDGVSFDSGIQMRETKFFFGDCISIEWSPASILCQIASVVFVTQMNATTYMNGTTVPATLLNDPTRICFCSGTFSYAKANQITKQVRDKAYDAFQKFKERPKEAPKAAEAPVSAADEIRKYKGLLDDGIITQEEFDKKKAELLK
jgi:hypothetical protein